MDSICLSDPDEKEPLGQSLNAPTTLASTIDDITADSACEKRVAQAAPAMPMPRKATATMSSTMFSSDEKTSRPSGIVDRPRELKMDERTLYRKRKGRPRK